MIIDRAAPTITLTLILAVAALAAVPAEAHVELDSPNGGETLEPGSTFTIVWHDVVSHGPADYDLWYSTSGPGGPWIDIVENVTPPPLPSGYEYVWTVPDASSNQVRVRVRQDNTGPDYEDISDADFSIQGEINNGTAVTLEPMRDAALYEGDGSLANGAGSYLFAGATNNSGDERRALLAFDVESAIPVGATITEVSLDLTMSRTISGAQTVELRRVLESWSEGPSDPDGQEGGGAAAENGDVTWVHRTYPSNMWSTVGGALASSASASVQVDAVGSYTVSSTPDLVADVQTWLDSPVDNHGWALVVPSPAAGSSKRFNSREHDSAGTRPTLRVTYEGGAPPTQPMERVLIPAAARAEGAGGSFFVTTADIHNDGSSSATVQLAWLPRNTDNSSPVLSAEFNLGPGETRRFDDLVAQAFSLDEGVGAAAVLSDSSDIEVMTRTYNQGAEGTFGQSLPGVDDSGLIRGEERALVLFLTENADLRSNLGLVNGVDVPITVRWELFASDGSSLGNGTANLPPFGNIQRNQVLGDVAPIEAAYAHVWTTTADGAFTCYGSVLDNQTSDPTTVLPQ